MKMIQVLIKSSIVSAVRDRCICNFSSDYITEETLVCISHLETQVVYRATITEYNNTFTTIALIQIIENFVSKDPNVSNQALTFTFNSDCTVAIESDDEICGNDVPSASASVRPTPTFDETDKG